MGASVLSPLFFGVGSSRGILRFWGLLAQMRVGVRVRVRVGTRLGGWPLLTLHVDTQPLRARLLATCLAAAV